MDIPLTEKQSLRDEDLSEPNDRGPPVEVFTWATMDLPVSETELRCSMSLD